MQNGCILVLCGFPRQERGIKCAQSLSSRSPLPAQSQGELCAPISRTQPPECGLAGEERGQGSGVGPGGAFLEGVGWEEVLQTAAQHLAALGPPGSQGCRAGFLPPHCQMCPPHPTLPSRPCPTPVSYSAPLLPCPPGPTTPMGKAAPSPPPPPSFHPGKPTHRSHGPNSELVMAVGFGHGSVPGIWALAVVWGAQSASPAHQQPPAPQRMAGWSLTPIPWGLTLQSTG